MIHQKHLSIVIFSLLCSLSISAQSGLSSVQRAVGYCFGDSITYNGVAFGQQVDYTIGAVATEAMLAPYVGCKVIGIRFALSQSIGNTRIVMARKNGASTTAVPHVEQTQRRTYEGWQNIWLNGANEFTIEAGEALFFGFDYSETAEMVAADAGAMCSFGTEEYEGGFCLLSNNTLYSISGAGSLCVQLIVDVTNMPRKAAKPTFFDTGFKYKQAGELTELFYTIANTGRENISTITIAYSLDGGEPKECAFEKPIAEGNADTYSINVEEARTLPVGRHEVRTYIKSIDGVAVETAAEDTLRASFTIYANTFERQKIYVEQYTSAKEQMAYYVNPIFNRIAQQHPNEVALVNVHQPGTELAIDESGYLGELYAYTWPSFTLNRAYYPGENYIAYDVNDYAPLGQDLVVGILNDMIMQEMYMPGFAKADIGATLDETTRRLTVTVEGTLVPEAEAMFGDVALTVLLTEDGIHSSQKVVSITGRTTTNSNYEHNHVLRAYLSAPTGDKVEVSDNTFKAQYAFDLPATWNTDKMNIVAFVTQYADAVTDANLMDMDIIGANSIAMSTAEKSGIGTVGLPENMRQDNTTYNLAGQRVGNAYRGIVLRGNKKVVVR